MDITRPDESRVSRVSGKCSTCKQSVCECSTCKQSVCECKHSKHSQTLCLHESTSVEQGQGHVTKAGVVGVLLRTKVGVLRTWGLEEYRGRGT